MSERIGYLVFGILISIVVQLVMDSVRRWREIEDRRKKNCVVANMFRSELESRLRHLNHNCAEDFDVTLMDQVLISNFRSSGQTFNFELLENNLRKIFDTFSSYLVDFRPEVSEKIVSHYQSTLSRLKRFVDQLSDSTHSREDSVSILEEVRSETEFLIDKLRDEAKALAPRSYLDWVCDRNRG